MAREPVYGFREVTAGDLPLLRRWLAEPHMRQSWTDDAEAALARIEDAIDGIEIEPLIVELGGRPIAYLQCYDPHLEDGHPYQDQPFGTLGLDLSIGPAEMLGQGHGPAILRRFSDQLFEEGAPRLIIDPNPSNARAIRAFEKAGYRHFDTRNSIYGPACMMALDAPEET